MLIVIASQQFYLYIYALLDDSKDFYNDMGALAGYRLNVLKMGLTYILSSQAISRQ